VADQRLRTDDVPIDGVSYKYWLLRVPNVDLIRSAVLGALSRVAYWSNWVQDGNMSAEETAQEIKQMILGIKDMNFLIGLMVMSYADNPDDSLLLADGSTYAKADYPELWEYTPNSMKTATHFDVVDMSDRFPVGASATKPELTTAGQESVVLTVPELPSHNHVYDKPVAGLDIEGVGVPDPLAISNPMIPTGTTFTGSNQAHDNMPPYTSLSFYVVAKL